MSEHTLKRIQQLVLITDLKNKNKFMNMLVDFDGHAIDTMYGHSSVSSGNLSRAFGFDVEKSKIVLSCLLTTENALSLINELKNKHNFDKPNTGIAFTIPVEGIIV